MDRIENKFIDKLDYIESNIIMDYFDCNTHQEVSEIITRYFQSRKTFNGTINLTGTQGVTSLYNIRRIEGNLSSYYSHLGDLGELRVVKGEISIIKSPLVSTGKLLYCESITIDNKEFKEFKKLADVNGNVFIRNSKYLESLGSLTRIGGDLTLRNLDVLSSTGNVNEVLGTLKVYNCDDLHSLEGITTIFGSLDIRDGNLSDFGDLKKLNGFVFAKLSKMNGFDKYKDDVMDMEPIRDMWDGFPKSLFLKVPKVDKLEDFGLFIIDDSDKI